ncbi:hypothetical protein [Streptomyces sp. NPDC000851]
MKRQLLTLAALLGALALGASTTSAAGAPQRAETGTAYIDTLGGGQWLVSGEWGAQHRFQVFPAPLLNPSMPPTSIYAYQQVTG